MTRNLLAVALAATACGTPSDPAGSTAADPSDIASVADAVDTASDLASAEDLAGMTFALQRPTIFPGELAGFRCDAKPEVTMGTVCGHFFPSSVTLSWSACDERSPDGPRHHGDAGVPAPMTSSGTVTITTTVTTDPAGTCTLTTKITVERSTVLDLTTAAADGSRTLAGTVTSTSDRDPSAHSFVLTDTDDVTVTDKDADGNTTKSRHLAGTVTSTFAGGMMPDRTIDGTISDTVDGATATVTLTGVVRPARFSCRWPTAGTIVRTAADGTKDTLSFGPACGQATYNGAAVTLPTDELGVHHR